MDKRYISVHSLNQYIKARFNQDVQLQHVYIKGEISNYRPHPSGHLYFTLKDDQSRISAVMFASNARRLQFELKDGMKVLIQARVGVYEVTGEYQLYVNRMEPDGIGALYLSYNELKDKLEKEGLFDDAHKKPIPAFPHRIAVLAARQGDALQDVLNIINRRAPFVRVVIFPIPVQGKNAYMTISHTLREVDKLSFDEIILARGGGSLENLMNFNNELLARTIYALNTPIISGIGHETDYTICDFVSDARGVTPTDAALKATPDCQELKRQLNLLENTLVNDMNQRLEKEKRNLDRLSHSYFLMNPDQLYANEILKVNHLEDRLISWFKMFKNKNRQEIDALVKELKRLMDNRLVKEKNELTLQIEKLDAFSPLKLLTKGYSLVYQDEHLIKSVKEIKKEKEIIIQMSDGQVEAEVKQVKS